MIDDATFVLPNPGLWSNSVGPFERNNLRFVPLWNNHGEIFCYSTSIKKLRLSLFHSEIRLDNSFHKFAHGNNSDDFTRSEIIETIETLNEITGLNWWNSNVKKIEYGCNLMDLGIDSIISSL